MDATSPQPTKGLSRFHIPALDGARGLAVLFVLLDHCTDAGLLTSPGLNFNRAGMIGVLLFFALSSFLLSFLLFAQDDAALAKARTWGNYFLRRFLRVYPLFALALIVWANWRRTFNADDVVRHLLLRDGQRHFWTIPVEFKYYLVLPLLVWLAAVWWPKRRVLVVVLGLALAAFLRFGLKPIERAWSFTNDIWLEDYLTVFLLGTLLGFLHARPGWLAPLWQRWKRWIEALAWISLAIALFYIPMIYHAVVPGAAPVRNVPKTVQVLSLVWPLFLFGTLHGTGWMARVLSFAPLRWMGLVSYSVYLWHPLVMQQLKGLAWPAGVRLVLFFTVVFAVATLSFFLVERPLANLRLRKRPPGSPAAHPEAR